MRGVVGIPVQRMRGVVSKLVYMGVFDGWGKVGVGDDVRAISPSEDVGEAPRADLGFSFFAGERCHLFDKSVRTGGKKELDGWYWLIRMVKKANGSVDGKWRGVDAPEYPLCKDLITRGYPFITPQYPRALLHYPGVPPPQEA